MVAAETGAEDRDPADAVRFEDRDDASAGFAVVQRGTAPCPLRRRFNNRTRPSRNIKVILFGTRHPPSRPRAGPCGSVIPSGSSSSTRRAMSRTSGSSHAGRWWVAGVHEASPNPGPTWALPLPIVRLRRPARACDRADTQGEKRRTAGCE